MVLVSVLNNSAAYIGQMIQLPFHMCSNITCQIKYATNIHNYTLQAVKLQFEVYLDGK